MVRFSDILEGAPSARAQLESLQANGLEVMRKRFLSSLARMENACIASEVVDLYQALPVPNRVRVLLSAELGSLLNCHDVTATSAHLSAEDSNKLVSLLQTESMVARVDSIIEDNIDHSCEWRTSALGDVDVAYIDGRVTARRRPRIGQTITVDFDSYIARSFERRSGILSQTQIDITDLEKKSVVEKLDAALALIDGVMPVYGLMIRQFNRRIVVRCSIASDDDIMHGSKPLGSEHTLGHPGSIRLLNPHLRCFTLERAVEALLHESMHCVLATREIVEGRRITPIDRGYRPVSPWSGNAIPNTSLAHAVFVYFVLLKMFTTWLNHEEIQPSAKTVVKSRILHFARGFLARNDLSAIFTWNHEMRSEIKKEFREISVRALEIMRNSSACVAH
jgi:hypothetical protein